MDPNAALAEIRALTAKILYSNINQTHSPHDAVRLAELIEGLDQWIARGGFRPKAWT